MIIRNFAENEWRAVSITQQQAFVFICLAIVWSTLWSNSCRASENMTILNACFPHQCLFDVILTFSRLMIASFFKLGLCMTLSVRTDKSMILCSTMLLFCWHWADATVHNQFRFHIISCGSLYFIIAHFRSNKQRGQFLVFCFSLAFHSWITSDPRRRDRYHLARHSPALVTLWRHMLVCGWNWELGFHILLNN
jgi:hypothetical protein